MRTVRPYLFSALTNAPAVNRKWGIDSQSSNVLYAYIWDEDM